MSDRLLLEDGVSALLLESASNLLLESAPLDTSGWRYHRDLTDTAATSLTSYVCKLVLTAANFDFSLAKADGSDLRVLDDTTSTFLPLWLFDYDPVGQTATIYFRAANTSHPHSIYYGNPAAAAVSSFAAVFDHGTGFDSGWGDLTTQVAGATGAAIRYAGVTGASDPRNLYFWRHSENPVLQIGDLTAQGIPQGNYQGVREINLVRDSQNRVLQIGGKYYVTFSRRPSVNTDYIDGYIGSGTSKNGPFSNFSPIWTPGPARIDHPCSVLKIGSTYYAFCNYGWAIGGGTTPPLAIKLKTSTDLVTWTDQGVIINASIWNDQVSGACTDCGNPWVVPLADGTYMLLCEAYNSANSPLLWGCSGATSPGPPFTSWTPLNSGNPLVPAGAVGTWNQNGSANPKCFQMPDGSFVIQINGSDITRGTGTGANEDWQHGYYTAPAAGGPYTAVAVNPVAGKPLGSYGVETAHFSWDEDGKSYFNYCQRFASGSWTAAAYRLFQHPRQGGLSLSRADDGSDAAAYGVNVGSGSFTAEIRSVYTSHRTNNANATVIGLMNAASLPAPMVAGSLTPLRAIEITRSSLDLANPGDLLLLYWDTVGTVHYWTGSGWGTTATYLACDYAREIVATIQDDGTNYILKAVYADDGSSIAIASPVLKTSVRAMPAGRTLWGGDLVTSAWCGTTFIRYLTVRPYAATEPVMTAGPLVGGLAGSLVDGGLISTGLLAGIVT